MPICQSLQEKGGSDSIFGKEIGDLEIFAWFDKLFEPDLRFSEKMSWFGAFVKKCPTDLTLQTAAPKAQGCTADSREQGGRASWLQTVALQAQATSPNDGTQWNINIIFETFWLEGTIFSSCKDGLKDVLCFTLFGNGIRFDLTHFFLNLGHGSIIAFLFRDLDADQWYPFAAAAWNDFWSPSWCGKPAIELYSSQPRLSSMFVSSCLGSQV